MDVETRLAGIVRNTEEVVTPEELKALLERAEHPRSYIGYEPSGPITIAHLITVGKIRDLVAAGCDVTVYLADWHAWINDKLGADLERIRACGRYVQAAFGALGVDAARVRYRWASDLTGSSQYWARVVRVAKATSLARTKRAMSIMGRTEEESDLDTSRLFYPAMQAADIFELPVDLAYGGMDQRRAHVLAREVAHHYDWPVPSAIHTPLLGSLKGSGRMDPVGPDGAGKMSKSDPSTAVPIPSSDATIRERIGAAFCPAKQVDGNPVVEIVRFIVFPWEGKLAVDRKPAHGGPVELASLPEFLDAWSSGALHPQDLKAAVAASLDRLTAPARQYFAEHPGAGPESFAAKPVS